MEKGREIDEILTAYLYQSHAKVAMGVGMLEDQQLLNLVCLLSSDLPTFEETLNGLLAFIMLRATNTAPSPLESA